MIKRHLEHIIPSSLASFPVVLLTGARQVGKSTLVKHLQQQGAIRHIITLDDYMALESARRDPEGFLTQFPGSLAIDEVQRAPDLLVAIKKMVDEKRQPGRFFLTGSANILSYPGITESLAGRMDMMHLEGLSLAELGRKETPGTFLEDLSLGLSLPDLAAKWNEAPEKSSPLTREQIFHHIYYGGFPEVALKADQTFCGRWYASYQAAYVERDVRDLSRLLDVVSFSKVFRLAGLQTAQLFNVKKMATEVGLDQRTVSRYLEILELTFQVNLLRPYFTNARKQFIKTPKIYMNDSGYACFLAGVASPAALPQHPAFEALLETWMWAEIRKLLSLTVGFSAHFYRTHQGREVDFLLTRGQTCWGIECKASPHITPAHLKGLEDLLPLLGGQAYGLILCPAERAFVLSDRIIAAPISILG